MSEDTRSSGQHSTLNARRNFAGGRRNELYVQTIRSSRSAIPIGACAGLVEDGLEVEAAARLLRIVLDNLLGNAWKFTARTADPVVELGRTSKNGEAVYVVRDNGAGFDQAYADRLFAPFQRLHLERDFPGTGIGLAIVQRVVRRHGGRIWAEAAVGHGATFMWTLS